ncbi:MAG: hypothetical protein V4719_30630 [Planctomycetota bacterium]
MALGAFATGRLDIAADGFLQRWFQQNLEPEWLVYQFLGISIIED